jgi:hypothetical protein
VGPRSRAIHDYSYQIHAVDAADNIVETIGETNNFVIAKAASVPQSAQAVAEGTVEADAAVLRRLAHPLTSPSFWMRFLVRKTR